MSLTVYQMPHSPYCIPITQGLSALGVDFETIDITPHTREEVILASDGMSYQVPMLNHDGHLVVESSAESIDIARYIDRNFAHGRLFPPAGEASHIPLVTFIENDLELSGFKLVDPSYIGSIADIVAQTLIVRHKERKFGVGCVDEWRANHAHLFARFVSLLAPCETTLARQPFLLGDTPVYADFALFGVLENVTYRGWNTLPETLIHTGRWRDQIAGFTYPDC